MFLQCIGGFRSPTNVQVYQARLRSTGEDVAIKARMVRLWLLLRVSDANETPLRRPCSTSFFLLSYELKLWTKVVGIVVAAVHTKDSFLVFFSRKFLGNFYHSGLGACQRCRCPAPSGSFEWTSERWRFSPVTQPDGSGFRWSRCVASDEKTDGEHLFFGGCTIYFIGWEGETSRWILMFFFLLDWWFKMIWPGDATWTELHASFS